ncbi:PQQ-dependent sugar dehydrogenase [Ectothiorhodospira lacustris]|uniref:PQQ-dependent sugar dehydrogenase n=1 Tax=Ectothiorhodospira lacustris TaxID=2899127 RepID=UPI001EE7E03C|nr:PQQ-dependent sugar dehydrogenase [Ectothiorhodospira lacustris]MCG5501623.1 PQQ-dependent sugar dehydrogenase [Ectothiorhodospira lacustris]MCG5511443.1 PQQ-dependent sugar dehydrogenase [Ectothiorhodospira lacustris]MCG5523229.1 PQQ-dependent sugar dehydrogenase [Ectothiorhodospira lacustris]
MRIHAGNLWAGATLWLALAAAPALAEEVVERSISSEYQSMRLVKVVDGLTHPWAVAFLPDGRKLISERPNGLVLVDRDGRKAPLQGFPAFHAFNQGGVLDVVLHPRHEDNGWIYVTYSKGDARGTVPALIRARLDGGRLTAVENIFESNTYTQPGRHYGSRLLFLPDGTLLMTIGDRGAHPPRAQDTLDHSGSIVRLNDDGTVPEDNPFVGQEGYAPEIYTYGNRNIQGMALHPATGEVWVTEHGPRGGDELNLIEAGNNYGWPVVTLGRDYRSEDRFPDAQGRQREGMVDPVFEFLPTLAPSGLAVVDSAHFPRWQGNLLAGGLRAQRILRLVVEDHAVVHAEELLRDRVGRVRDVRQGPDGYLYVLNDAPNGALYRIEPAR